MGVYSVNKTTGELNLIAGGTLYADAPVGAIIPYGGAAAPSGWLLCQGQAVSRTTYAALFSAIGTAFGSGDDSTTFNLPDLRESVPVGTGTRASGITAHDTYTVGQFKDDQMQNHDHYRYPNNKNGWSLYADSVGDQGYGMFASDSTSYDNGSYTGNVHTGRTGTTTHGKQLGVNYIIKAQQSALPIDLENAVDDMLAEVTDVIPSGASASNQLVTASDNTNAPITVLKASSSNVVDFDDLVPDNLTISSRKIFMVISDNTNVVNSPRSTRNMIVICYNTVGNVTRQNQIAISEDGTKQMWQRNCTSGTWSTWTEFLTGDMLTSSVTSGSSAPITAGGVAGSCPYKVFSNFSNEGNVMTYTLADGHYECKVYYYDGLCGIYDMVKNQFGNNGGHIATVWDDSAFKNYTISIEQSTGVVSMSGTASDNVQFVITALP